MRLPLGEATLSDFALSALVVIQDQASAGCLGADRGALGEAGVGRGLGPREEEET